MKSFNRILLAGIAVLLIALINSCDKDDDDKQEDKNMAPLCLITSPNNGQIFFLSDSIFIQAEVSDDGSIADVRFFFNDIGIGSSVSPPYEFLMPTDGYMIGNHTVSVTAIDKTGLKTEDKISVKLSDGTPIADFKADTTVGVPPLEVSFTNLSTNEPTEFKWDFGDGGFSNEENPSHTYSENGVYSVRLIVASRYGSDTALKSNLIVVMNEPTGSFVDPRDDQEYNVLQIGDLQWFGRNLNYEITNSWWFNNNPDYGSTFGRLYTYEAAMIACPPGWHLPSDDEWKNLELALGMSGSELDNEGWRGTDEGKRMKATTSWNENGNGNNESGFNAFSGGWHDGDMTSYNMGISTVWWTNTASAGGKAVRRVLRYDNDGVYRNSNWIELGFSVRCVKD